MLFNLDTVLTRGIGDWAVEDQAETWTGQPVHTISDHSAHLTPLPELNHPWIWRWKQLFNVDFAPSQGSDFTSNGEKMFPSGMRCGHGLLQKHRDFGFASID